LCGADVLGPDIGLHAENVAALIGRQCTRQRIEAVHVLESDDIPASWLIVEGTLPVVEIQSRYRRQYCVVACGRSSDAALDAAPGRHGRVLRDVAAQNLVPT